MREEVDALEKALGVRVGYHPSTFFFFTTLDTGPKKVSQPSTPNPDPYTLHPSPSTLHPPPYTLHPTLNTLHTTLSRNPRPWRRAREEAEQQLGDAKRLVAAVKRDVEGHKKFVRKLVDAARW